jgi:4'-phosphopantetheinyl transferase
LTANVEVEIIRADVRTFDGLAGLSDVLSPEESRRHAAFKVREPAETFLLSRALLRRELSKRLSLPPSGIVFEVRTSGKPDLRRPSAEMPDWRFSVSHTGPHVALAFALGADIGVDIERWDRLTHPLDIASRYFTPREQQGLRAASPDDLPRAFFAGWTRKEAIVKARGSTMSESLDTVSVDLDPLSVHPGYVDALNRAPCRITAFDWAPERLIGAVAVMGDAIPLPRIQVCDSARFD